MKKEILIILITFGFSFGASILFFKSQQKKIAYVKVGELYEDFEMKKELEKSLLSVATSRKNILDSMELELKLIDKKLQSEGVKDKALIDLFEGKRENYFMRKNQFDEDNNQLREEYSSNIMKQLNQFVSDFGKENGYSYIFGAEGSGAIMFAEEKDEITKEVKVYVNNKFKGLKK